MKYVFSVEGDESLLSQSLDSFCAATGWVSEEESGTKLAHTRGQILNFLMGIVSSYNVSRASREAESQTMAALMQMSSILEQE